MSQAQVLEPKERFVLPSGKELKLHDVLRFCYDLSETDVQVLMALLRSGPKLAKELEQEFNLSKASVNRSLNKLLEMGLIKRTKETEKMRGRPRHIYYVPKFDELKEKLTKEIEVCTNSIRNVITARLTPSAIGHDNRGQNLSLN